MWVLNSSILGEKLGVGVSLPIVWHYARGGDRGKNVPSLPYAFRYGYFLICNVEESLTGLDLSKRNAAYAEHR